nr:hypothetical protein [Porphyrobacter sp. TH134]
MRLSFKGKNVGQADDAGLGGGIGCHLPVAENAGGRCGKQDPAVTLHLHVRPDRAGNVETSDKMGFDHRRKIGRLHLFERTEAHGAGAVDKRIDPAEPLKRGLDNPPDAFAGGNAVVIGAGLAAILADLLGDPVSRARVAALARNRAAKVVVCCKMSVLTGAVSSIRQYPAFNG